MEGYHYYYFFFSESRMTIHPSGKSGIYKGFTSKVNEITFYSLAASEDAHRRLHLTYFSS